jgi:uncharacterized membrane protein
VGDLARQLGLGHAPVAWPHETRWFAAPAGRYSDVDRPVTRSGPPPRNVYHRMLGAHAPTLARTALVLLIGSAVGGALMAVAPWQLALLAGWDAAAATFLATVWPLILAADSVETKRMATRVDDTRTVGILLLLAVCLSSVVGGGFALALAGDRSGLARLLLVLITAGTVVLSWLVLNTVYALRYADLYYGSAAPEGVAFAGTRPAHDADFRDFAYLAFTIGMTYQVSDTTLRSRIFRRTVLAHALFAYLFGVVIVAGAINLIASLLR